VLSKINAEAPLDKVCLLGCGIGTGWGAVFNVARVTVGSSVAVWGLGAIGLAVIAAAKSAGAATIIGIDMNPAKFAVAREFGATDCLNPSDFPPETPLQQILCERYNGGFDYTFECVGNVKTMKIAIESTRFGAGVCCIIGVAPEGKTVELEPNHLLMGITIKGSCFGGLKSRDALPDLVEKYLNKEIKVNEFITHRFMLDEINEAFDTLRQGKR
jgi:S-(hydroxymethyl)glutathione dehydrogenase/alcohol dehydrogenase